MSLPPSIARAGAGDSYFGIGATTFYVSVKPTSNSADGVWEVLVAEETQAKSANPVQRTDREFQALHRSLETSQATILFSEPLPHLPLHSALLVSSHVDSNLKMAAELQEYLAALRAHPEAPTLRAFADFVRPPDQPSAFPVDSNPLVRELSAAARSSSPGAIVRSRSGTHLDRTEAVPPAPTCTRVKLSWVDEDGDHEVELPVLTPAHALGNKVIDVRQLGQVTPFFTHDPGFLSTSSCTSAITYIDGDNGVLLHRGYKIDSLATRCSFPEVAYLLIEGELPSAAQLEAFRKELQKHALVHEKLLHFFQGFKSDAHPMAIMVGVVGALSAFYPEAMDIHSANQRRLSALQLISKMPTIAAISYKTAIGQPVVYPKHELSFAANFLHMMFATPCEAYTVHPVHAKALETILILHADHEQNASTSTVRIASSSQANPFACIAAGIASLWGPAHGGANEAVLRMLDEIGTPERIPTFIAKAKDKSDPFRLMGFGHRVYRNHDPRATLMRNVCHEVLGTVEATQLLELAQQLEAVALTDEYFVKRKLYPNVDFYSGLVLRAIGIPTNMFTVLFAVARTVGWLAQWNESFADTGQKISRPRQLYTGKAERPFVPVLERGEACPPEVK